MSLSTIAAEPVPIKADAAGVLRVGGTRVTVDAIVEAFYDGASAETIADQYSSVQLADVYSTIAFYLHHKEEVDEYLKRRDEQAAEVRKEIEARWPPDGVRERLLARRKPQGS